MGATVVGGLKEEAGEGEGEGEAVLREEGVVVEEKMPAMATVELAMVSLGAFLGPVPFPSFGLSVCLSGSLSVCM